MVSSNYNFMSLFQQYVYKSRYARFLHEEGRREDWNETVDRYFDFFQQHLKQRCDYDIPQTLRNELKDNILNFKVMPSMRAIMTSGEALSNSELASYNCSYVAIDTPKAFSEILFILMNGVGVGFSVERQYVNKLPTVPELVVTDTIISVADSRLGWAKGLSELISILYAGSIPKWDVSKLRPAGAILKTFGGRSSGPEPLVKTFNFIVEVFKEAQERKLTSIECHDIICAIADCVIVGGVRRSALISLSNLSDDRMRSAKSGQWWSLTPWRALANNSAVYIDKRPSMDTFMNEWKSLYDSKSGERGIFSRYASKNIIERANQFRKKYFGDDVRTRDSNFEQGTNPCVTGDMLVSTTNGLKSVETLIGVPFEAIVDGEKYNSEKGFWLTGFKKVYEVETEHGYKFKATDNHKILRETDKGNQEWVELKDIQIEDVLVINKNRNDFDINKEEFDKGWIVGECVGDGCYNPKLYKGLVRFWGETKEFMSDRAFDIIEKIELTYNQPVKPIAPTFNKINDTLQIQSKKIDLLCEELIDDNKNILPKLEQSSISFVAGFISGIFDADGTVGGSSNGGGCYIQLSQTNKNNLEAIQRMLIIFGIESRIRHIRDKGYNLLPDGKGENSLYETKDLYRLDIGRDNIERFQKLIGFCDPLKKENLEKIISEKTRESYKSNFRTQIKSIEYVGMENVYDCTIEDIHAFDVNGIIVHNCSEIILRDKQFCVVGDTKLITKEGIHNIDSLENKEVYVWNGDEWSNVIVRKTRENAEVIRVQLSDGSYLDCTPDHKFSAKTRFDKEWREVKAKDLLSEKYVIQLEPTKIKNMNTLVYDNAYTLGFAVGDGCVYDGKVIIDLYGNKIDCPVVGTRHEIIQKTNYNVKSQRVISNINIDDVVKLKTDINSFLNFAIYSRETILNFIAGLADADGSNISTGGIRIYISKEERARNLQLLLTSIGIRSSVNLMSKKGDKTNFGHRKDDIWYVQITDCNDIPCKRLNVINGHSPKYKGKYQNVVHIEQLDNQDVYCFNEPKNHKAVFNNVLTHQCNLSEVVIREDDTLETLKEKIKLATILGTFQSTLTNFKFLSSKWKGNTEDERLLGVSLTGIMDNSITSGAQGIDKLKEVLTELRKTAIETNIIYAKKLGINPSTAITAIKPSGCTSLNTKIKTQDGIKSMEEIWTELAPDINIHELNSGDWIEPIRDMKVYDENNELQKITKLYMNGISEVYEIEDEEGNKYKFTAEHKLKTTNGWKRVDDLSEGDEILRF